MVRYEQGKDDNEDLTPEQRTETTAQAPRMQSPMVPHEVQPLNLDVPQHPSTLNQHNDMTVLLVLSALFSFSLGDSHTPCVLLELQTAPFVG